MEKIKKYRLAFFALGKYNILDLFSGKFLHLFIKNE